MSRKLLTRWAPCEAWICRPLFRSEYLAKLGTLEHYDRTSTGLLGVTWAMLRRARTRRKWLQEREFCREETPFCNSNTTIAGCRANACCSGVSVDGPRLAENQADKPTTGQANMCLNCLRRELRCGILKRVSPSGFGHQIVLALYPDIETESKIITSSPCARLYLFHWAWALRPAPPPNVYRRRADQSIAH